MTTEKEVFEEPQVDAPEGEKKDLYWFPYPHNGATRYGKYHTDPYQL